MSEYMKWTPQGPPRQCHEDHGPDVLVCTCQDYTEQPEDVAAWETVEDGMPDGETSRLTRIPVPGGWLYRVSEWDRDEERGLVLGVGLAFVPDPPPGD